MNIIIKILLYPLSLIYQVITDFRNLLFDWGINKQQSFPFPIISIGNLTVGGTGKTPHTELLIRLLLKQSYKIAVLSRGYKRKTKGTVFANENSTPQDIGDEPYQIYRKFFGQIDVFVDEKRCRALSKIPSDKYDVILLDDAYQHRYVKPGLSILLNDFNRPFYKDFTLPLGRLRESRKGKNRADIIITTKCDIHKLNVEDEQKNIAPNANQSIYFSQIKYGDITGVFEQKKSNIDLLTDVFLVTGIANPQPIIEYLQPKVHSITVMTFNDHHDFTKNDIKTIENQFNQINSDKRIVLMTEKDAVKIFNSNFVSSKNKSYFYYLPIEVEILKNQEKDFTKKIIDYVEENKRNRTIH